MATITKRDDAYHIMVSCGYDMKNHQIRKTRTWNPQPGMTAKQIEKAVNEAAVLFENKVRTGHVLEGNITFADFVQRWLKEYAEQQLAPKTTVRYLQILKRVLPAIGHIHLDKLQPIHLIEFYNNLAEDGIRTERSWVARPALLEKYRSQNPKITLFAKSARIGAATVESVLNQKPASKYIAERMCEALGLSLTRGFKEKPGRTTLGKRTIRHHHCVISSILNTAMTWQVIPDNPAKRVKPPKVPRLEAKYLNEAQTAHLLECIIHEPLKYQTMIKLLLYSGMRRGELCGLEWTDVNWDKQILSIKRSSQYLPDRGIFTKETKTQTSDRSIKLPAVVFELLETHQAWQDEEKGRLGSDWRECDRIFTIAEGGPIHPDTVTSWFSQFVKKYDLPPVTIHSLRHTNITLMIMAGVPLRTVAQRAGHASTVTTSLIYSHAIQSSDEMASDVLEDILKPHLSSIRQK